MRTWINLIGLFVFSSSLLISGAVYAQNYSFPLIECDKKGGCYVTAYYDLNRSSGYTRDWNCKTKTYDQHSGTDYGIGSFDGMDANGSRPAVAAADGTVVAVSDGAYDRNTSSTYSSYCGTSTSCGNYVKLKHENGRHTIYCHMKKGSVKVSNGQSVKCGQELGRVGSSGCSTGPHLHFGVYLTSGSTDDPYAATSSSCGGTTSYWVSQGAYLDLPAYTCCNPNCSGKNCGDDGCGGSCGSCSGQDVCESNKCVCKPNCSGKTCGEDGCGGSCGSCSGQDVCENNKCVCKPACSGKACGDDGCGGSCGECTGAQDVCENNQCVCKPDCNNKVCGDDGCGGSCGECTGAQDVCENNQCICQPACTDKECGDDGCGGVCGECQDGYICEANACVCVPQCDGKTCGDDGCGGSCGECPEQHHCDDTGACICDPYCDGYECGDDGCGDSCGSCEKGFGCQDHLCVENACDPDCTDKQCGDDGCGGTCGSCETGQTCQDHRCIEDGCEPDCTNKQCGDDGCGGLCGTCSETEKCENNQCKDIFGGINPSIDLTPEEGCGCSQLQAKRQIPAWPLLLGILSALSLLGLRRRRHD